jgi:hypothetical protein
VREFVRVLDACNFAVVPDSGWTDWDVEASVGPWAKVRVRTVEEDHGGGHRLVRARFCLLPTLFTRLWMLLLLLAAALLATNNPFPAAVLCALVASVLTLVWQRATRHARSIIQIFDYTAQDLGYWRKPWRSETPTGERASSLGEPAAGEASVS